MNEIADQIILALRTVGVAGLRIDELATKLEMKSQKIATTITRLTSEGLIMQKQESEGERYVLSGNLPDDLDNTGVGDLNGCPCFHCLRIGKCGVRQPDSPVRCRELEEWMLTDSS
ncbi:MAG: hypothetical protein JSW61_08965 [Candidatus Thorarchaeota archaeon]|nr:MAG: hypothetical protein JSW61_08965 [Candidatus Thorarchaeota archaeon]